MNIRMPSDPHLRRWMLFVDGENFTIRGQEVAIAHDVTLTEGEHFRQDVYAWFPGIRATKSLMEVEDTPIRVQEHAIRAHFYTSAVGDEGAILEVKKSLHALGFQPEVFKKDKKTRTTKGVDIALSTDVLSNAYQDNFDVAVLFAGDGDYVPLVSQVKRLGKNVCVCFFANNGMNEQLKLAGDVFIDSTSFFLDQWRNA